jgi:hypothetical protein
MRVYDTVREIIQAIEEVFAAYAHEETKENGSSKCRGSHYLIEQYVFQAADQEIMTKQEHKFLR